MAQTTVFSDNFTGGSTIQSATPGAGTASSADYEVFSSAIGAPAGYSINPNALLFASPATGSTLAEVMARFGSPEIGRASCRERV